MPTPATPGLHAADEHTVRRLRAEFACQLDLETVELAVAATSDILRRDADFTNWFPLLVEKRTRALLREHVTTVDAMCDGTALPSHLSQPDTGLVRAG